MAVIEVTGLSKRFGENVAVDNVSLSIDEGEIVGFLGPNGSGKTTTIRMICGLLRPSAGEGRVLGLDVVGDAVRIKQQIGYMTQHFSLYEDLTIEENLAFVARLYKLRPVHKRVADSLRDLGLEARHDQLAGTLSGGWKQRLALAACTMHTPRILLLDEPTAGVDPKARRDFWDEIHRLAARGLTVLVSTHYMDEAERCHRIAYIMNGRLITVGQVDEVVRGARLTTFVVQGPDVAAVAEELQGKPGVDQVAPFGTTIHVVGHDGALLAKTLAPLSKRKGYRVSRGETSLEDVFIQFLNTQGSRQ